MRIGIAFGCFIPLHVGHKAMIERAIKENDKVIIGVCGYDKDRGKNFVPFRDRLKLIKKIYKDQIVVAIDDTKLGLDGTFTLHNWELWATELFTQADKYLPKTEDYQYTWYTGEVEYAYDLNRLYPTHEFTVIDRNRLPISGTIIREHWREYTEFIDPVYLKYLNEKFPFNAKEEIYNVVNWIQDWFKDNGPTASAVIGISGGKDSTIVAMLLVKALGKDRVYGVLMPNGKQKDIGDSLKVVQTLDIPYSIINIEKAFNGLVGEFDNPSDDVIINIPPRLRMTTLYAIAQNKKILPNGGRVVNTCNKSEDYVGYSTKFGDSVGDFSPCSDFLVTEMLQIGDELIKEFPIPYNLIHKTPSDGLCGKTDEDNLGFTYAELDKYILTREIDDIKKKENIDRRHILNLHKLNPMPMYKRI